MCECVCHCVFVPPTRSIYSKFLEAALAELKGYTLGDPLDKGTGMGPMALPTAPAFLQKQVADALEKGARLLTGGTTTLVGGKGRFFAPTLLVDVNHTMDVMVSESFGPIVAVMPVDSDAHAVQLMNDSLFGLTAAVFTKDVPRFEALAAQMECGTVYLNRSVVCLCVCGASLVYVSVPLCVGVCGQE